MSRFELVTTRGGSPAVRDQNTGEIMHPVGPVHEAEQLYVEPSRLAERLGEAESSPLVVYDVGLGAGSNAIAAFSTSEARSAPGRRLELTSFDRTAAAMELVLDSVHAEDFGLSGTVAAAARAVLEHGRFETAHTSWRLVLGELPATMDSEPAGKADIIYWDPFSPKSNPSLWTVAAFSSLRRACGDQATVHTYSAATSTRAAMLLAGFCVGFGASTGTKEHTTTAATNPGALDAPLGSRWLDRLGRSSAPLPADAPANALERIRRAPQFS